MVNRNSPDQLTSSLTTYRQPDHAGRRRTSLSVTLAARPLTVDLRLASIGHEDRDVRWPRRSRRSGSPARTCRRRAGNVSTLPGKR